MQNLHDDYNCIRVFFEIILFAKRICLSLSFIQSMNELFLCSFLTSLPLHPHLPQYFLHSVCEFETGKGVSRREGRLRMENLDEPASWALRYSQQNNPNGPSINTMRSICTAQYYSAIKMNDILPQLVLLSCWRIVLRTEAFQV